MIEAISSISIYLFPDRTIKFGQNCLIICYYVFKINIIYSEALFEKGNNNFLDCAGLMPQAILLVGVVTLNMQFSQNLYLQANFYFK